MRQTVLDDGVREERAPTGTRFAAMTQAWRRRRPWPEIALAMLGVACILAALIVPE